mmetsp:Transcript_1513/g.2055  ORF Transcript_1513/g.2055 Transcript_1513/m.2055 type:complete len:94 (-) Transcript_1513:887-1168(-)
MNVFGFADDLNADDRKIVKNQTENTTFRLVERPRFLMSFELKDQEDEYLLHLQSAEIKRTLRYLVWLVLFPKVTGFWEVFKSTQIEEAEVKPY